MYKGFMIHVLYILASALNLALGFAILYLLLSTLMNVTI